MDKITGKEGKGVSGAGFEGRTGSNSYSALPKSSNASLGIDADVASGYGNAVSSSKATGLNVGSKETQSSRKNLGYDEPWAKGTVGATESMSGMSAVADDRGQFGESALAGSRNEGSTGATYGSGARAKGTGSDSGPRPGQTGSMALAKAGLSGSGGSHVSTNTDGPNNYDRGKAKTGQSIKSQVGNN